MKRLMAILAAGFLATACTDPYGNVDPLATGLAVGAGALAVGALGYAAGQNSATQYHYVAPAPRYYHRAPGYHYYHRPAPRYYHHAPRYHPGYRRW